jgi:hypothetical protein
LESNKEKGRKYSRNDKRWVGKNIHPKLIKPETILSLECERECSTASRQARRVARQGNGLLVRHSYLLVNIRPQEVATDEGSTKVLEALDKTKMAY